MRSSLNMPGIGPQHAITDLYDEERRSFMVQYPIWLVIALSLGGVVVFMITGFLGYDTHNALLGGAFLSPWALYLWVCAMLWTLQVSILRHSSLRRQLAAMLFVFIVSVTVVGASFFLGRVIADFTASLLGLGGQSFLHSIQHALQNPVVLAAVNIGILIAFGLDAAVRRVRWVRGRSPAQPSLRNELGSDFDPYADDLPTLQELVAADLLLGGLLLLLLAALVQAATSSGFAQTFSCVNSYATTGAATCQGPPITLQSFDVILAAIFFLLTLSLLVYAIARSPAFDTPTFGWRDDDELPFPLRTVQARVGRRMQRVSIVIHNTVQCLLSRVSAPASATNLVITVRTLLWPILVFVSVLAAGQFAHYIQSYLHGAKSISSIYTFEIPAVLWAVVSVMSAVFAPALLLFRLRVAQNGLRFLGLVGLTLLLTLWIFSLTLFAINILLVNIGVTTRQPFDPPGPLTLISVGSLLFFGVLLTVRRRAAAPTV